jgi:hypothetical protein
VPSLECRICGTTFDPRRVELCYDYCTADECQRRGVTPSRIVRVAVNKAADQFVRAEDVVPQGEIGRTRIDDAPVARPSSADAPPTTRSPRRRRSTLARLQAAEAELDRRLEACVERFERSEITADEMAQMRDDLIRAFNRMVMGENIRYRSMLRRRRPG